MTLNDLECPIYLKVLDVRTLWLSDSTKRIGVYSERTESGLERLGPLPLTLQLTRCFSAVAELLV